MGSEVVAGFASLGGEDNHLAPKTYTKVFEEQLPFYLSIGMSWDEFWNDDVEKVKFYRRAFDIKKDYENQKCWLLGAYFYEALCDVAPVLHAFSSATKPAKYVSQPFPLTYEDAERQKKEAEEKEAEQMRQAIMDMANNINKSRQTGG